MSFSTLRKYSGSHAMSPTVQASKGSGGAPSAASIPATAQTGSATNDAAALGGMGAVGAGLLGKFAYDKSKQDLIDKGFTGDEYLAANPDNGIMRAPEMTDFSKMDVPGADVLGGTIDASQGVVNEPELSFGKIIGNIPGMIGNGITGYWDKLWS